MVKKIWKALIEAELFERNRQAALARNAAIMKVALLSGIVVFLWSFAASLLFRDLAYMKWVFLLIVGVFALLLLLLRWSKTRFRLEFIYVVYGILIAYSTLTSSFVSPNYVCVTILSFLFLFPVLFLDKNWRINLATVLSATIYLLVVSSHKNPALLTDEIVNVVSFLLMGCVIGTFTRRAQLENFDMADRLRMSQEQYRLAMAQSGNILCRYDVADKSVNMTPEVAAIFAMPEKVLNVPYGPVRMGTVAPESHETYIQFYESILRGNKTGSAFFCCKTVTGWRWMQANYTTIFSEANAPVYAVISFLDITKQREREMAYERDAVTKLLNRATFVNHTTLLLDSRQEGDCHAFIMMDIDGFKKVNDTLGHMAGDKHLADVASCLQSMLRHDDIIGRLGGDEFAMCIKNIPDKENLEIRVKSICSALHRTLDMDVVVSASMGIALFPQDGQSFELLYKKADVALYEAKRKGKNRYEFYTASLESADYVASATPIDKETH